MTPSIKIEQFNPEKHAREWDCFITNEAVNASFIHTRQYIGYHGDKFVDLSLVITKSDKIISVVPAVKNNTTVLSHPGLTFGGILISSKCHHNNIAASANLIKEFYKRQGINQLVLTPPPYTYQIYPTDDIAYILSNSGATLSRRRLLSVIDLSNPTNYSTLRKRGIKKAISLGLNVKKSNDFETFYTMLSENLSTRYNTTPVHTLQELKMLASNFPENIKLYMSFDGDMAVAGAVIYDSQTVTKTQYIASTIEGRNHGAVDLLLSTIIENARFENKRYFDLGSSEDSPNIINQSLLFQKEGFGARGVCLETYTLDL